MNEKIVLNGTVEHIVYQNAENGYAVFELAITGGGEAVCTGNLYGLNEAEVVKLTGQYVNHPSYGRQFNVEFYEKSLPIAAQGIERYLASGAIKGIGAKLAARITAKFGDDTINIIENEPAKLAQINGITLKKAIAVSEAFHEQKEQRDMLIALQSFGISTAYGTKIYKKFGAGSLEVLKKNPYLLCDEIRGIGFKTADAIAMRMGIEESSVYRVRSFLKYFLNETAALEGHCFLPKTVLLENARNFLSLKDETIEEIISEMQINKELYVEKADTYYRVYLSFYHFAEVYAARKLYSLVASSKAKPFDITSAISAFEAQNGIVFAENQITAIKEAVNNGVFVLTGGPGTGKTTTLNAIIYILKKQGYAVELAAPTGRAAKRLSEATNCEARTIHRLLGVSFGEDGGGFAFEKNESEPIEADAFIIDEASMMDISLTYHLLKAIPEGAKLILTGDADQLPSVGPGNVLRDILQSRRISFVALNTVFRQAQMSAIVTNAHKINKGEYPDLKEKTKDFFFITNGTSQTCAETIVELASKRLPAYLKTNSLFDIQVLCPMRKFETGVYSLNTLLQEKMNPASRHKREKQYKNIIWREGDKVMHIKNNYNLKYTIYNKRGYKEQSGEGVFNGDVGVIKTINPQDESITVVFDDDKHVAYDYSQLDELEHAFAVTIHKSQGSEYRAVIIPVLSGPPMLMSRNLLYTALTRAKQLAVIVGLPQTLYKMIDNDRETERYTTLKERLFALWSV